MFFSTIDKILIILGAIFLFLISPYISSIFPFFPHIHVPSSVGNIVFPGNLLILLMPILFKDGALFFIPGCFVVLSLFFNKKEYIYFFTSIVSALIILDAIWIAISWKSGINHYEIDYVIAILAENGLCFSVIFILIVAFYKWKKISFLYFSALFLCLTLTFFSFPVLGELISSGSSAQFTVNVD